MAEKDPSATGLTPEQTEKVIDDLHKRGATFFTWKQLQAWIVKFGPRAKMSDVQEAVKAEKDKEPKQ